MTHTLTSRWCWRKDLAGFRGLSERDRGGFVVVLEWFEGFRMRQGLDAGREAARAFWKIQEPVEILRKPPPPGFC